MPHWERLIIIVDNLITLGVMVTGVIFIVKGWHSENPGNMIIGLLALIYARLCVGQRRNGDV